MLRRGAEGKLAHAVWQGMECALFFAKRLLPDIVTSYYGHPTPGARSASAARRVRAAMCAWGIGRRDPWEAAEAKPGHEDAAARDNAPCRMTRKPRRAARKAGTIRSSSPGVIANAARLVHMPRKVTHANHFVMLCVRHYTRACRQFGHGGLSRSSGFW